MTIINVCGSAPGVSDLICLSSQAEYTYCFAEDPRLSPWAIIVGSCTTLVSNNSYIPGNLIIVLTPDHARLLDRDGFDAMDAIPVTRFPRDVEVVAAGGRKPGSIEDFKKSRI